MTAGFAAWKSGQVGGTVNYIYEVRLSWGEEYGTCYHWCRIGLMPLATSWSHPGDKAIKEAKSDLKQEST